MSDEPQSVTQGVTKVATGIVSTMSGNPLSLALLLINIAFLGFAAYILGEVAASARERNKVQNELITNLVRDIRDCRQPARPQQPTSEPISNTTTPVEASPGGEPR
jgi:hypothetical protein